MTPNRRLTRSQAVAYLNEQGYRSTVPQLATMATRGGGPDYVLFGKTPLYEPDKLLRWAEGRLTTPRICVSEADAYKAA